MYHAHGRRGFILVDLVFLVAVLALAAAMFVPWLFKSRETARRTQCANNLKMVCLALLNYEQANMTFPSGMICDKGEDPALTDVFRPNWVILTLPFLEESALQRSFDIKAPISDPRNRVARGTFIPVLLCPSDAANNKKPFNSTQKAEGDNWARGNYAVNAGNVFIGKEGGVANSGYTQWLDNQRRGIMAVNDCTMDLAGIRDGTAQTILAGEVRAGVDDKDRRGAWAMGMAGSSIACAHGSWGDDNGPNACNRWADDIKGGDQVKVGPAAEDRCMDPWGKSGSRQATFRSLHPGGCNVVFADGSVHLISDAIETSGPWGDASTGFWPTWDRLICSSDRHAVDAVRIEVAPGDSKEVQGAKLVKVAGTVKFKDGSVPEGEYRCITFCPVLSGIGPEAEMRGRLPREPRKGAGGEIGADGRFELTTIKPGDGVLPGRYWVTVKCVKSYADPDSLTIPKKYAEVSTTPLEVTIDRGRGDVDFVLDK